MLRVGAAVPSVDVADCAKNTQNIIGLIDRAADAGVRILVFPELCLCGYTCGDLLLQPTLQTAALDGLLRIAAHGGPVVSIVGLPLMAGGRLFNCAAVVSGGRVAGIAVKQHLPNYAEFYEQRWFSPASEAPAAISLSGDIVPMGGGLLFESDEACFGVEICEDLWVPAPPSGPLCMAGAQLIFNPSASNEVVTKHRYRTELISQQSARCMCGYVYAGAGYGESTTDLVFAGYAGVYENGRLLAENRRFARSESLTVADVDLQRLTFKRARNRSFFTDAPQGLRRIPIKLGGADKADLLRPVSPMPFVPTGTERETRTQEILSIQKNGLLTRFERTGLHKAVIGVSGGLDSTLTLLVTAHAFREAGYPADGLHAITMPGFGTGSRTLNNARALMARLGCTVKEIPIGPAVTQHFADIGQNPDVHDVAYENAQARERTQVLMDYANRIGALVMGTGDLSELALGWCTYNGDQMSMYNINGSVPKTLIQHLVRYMGHTVFGGEIAAIVDDILDTPISPELIPSKEGEELSQRTEDVLGAYALHDFFLYNMMDCGAGPDKLLALAEAAFAGAYTRRQIVDALETFTRRFFSQQFKRSCMPDGPKVGSVSLSPRGDWRMPSDASAALWLNRVRAIRQSLSYCEVYPLDGLSDYRFIVTLSRYQDKILLSQHKKRATWETQGGHIEPGETPEEAARRELYEESGATDFTLTPLFDYRAGDEKDSSNGRVFFADIRTLSALPESEMARTCTFDCLPENLTYPAITPVLFRAAKERFPGCAL